MQDYGENDKPLLKDIVKDLNKWSDLTCSGIGRLNTVKFSIIPNLICGLTAILVKISTGFKVYLKKIFFFGTWQADSKMYTEEQKVKNSKDTLEEKEQAG